MGSNCLKSDRERKTRSLRDERAALQQNDVKTNGRAREQVESCDKTSEKEKQHPRVTAALLSAAHWWPALTKQQTSHARGEHKGINRKQSLDRTQIWSCCSGVSLFEVTGREMPAQMNTNIFQTHPMPPLKQSGPALLLISAGFGSDTQLVLTEHTEGQAPYPVLFLSCKKIQLSAAEL